jgi:hypothetical protein
VNPKKGLGRGATEARAQDQKQVRPSPNKSPVARQARPDTRGATEARGHARVLKFFTHRHGAAAMKDKLMITISFDGHDCFVLADGTAMHLSNEANEDRIDALSIEIEKLFNRDPDLAHGEALLACMTAIANVVASITCPGCRKKTAMFVKRRFSVFITNAMTHGKKREGARPSLEHVH